MALTLTIGLLSEISHLRRKTITDELTGLYNRRYIDERLPAEILTCTQRKSSLSVIFSYLDYYKRIIDVSGHAAGDYGAGIKFKPVNHMNPDHT
jgi:two-component system cell cycle response regulator